MRFQVKNATSGQVIGYYEAHHERQALEIVAQELGFHNYAELQTAVTVGFYLVVKPCPKVIGLEGGSSGKT